MSAELHPDDQVEAPVHGLDAILDVGQPERSRPNVSGDLPTIFQAAPMFRRTVAGYDRFQVDTYVQWAEDELATADRERERLEARHLRTRAALEEARRLLTHSAAGGEFLQVSHRIGSMLAAAADQAENIRAEAAAERSAAAEQAERTATSAARTLADAESAAEAVLAEAAADVDAMIAEARRIVAEAERTSRQARLEAEVRLEQVRVIEQRGSEHADQVRQRAREEAAAALAQARSEVVRMLGTGREERRRADAQAVAARERLDREAAERTASLLAEVRALEHRRAALQAEVEQRTGPVAATTGRPDLSLGRLLGRLRPRSRTLQAP